MKINLDKFISLLAFLNQQKHVLEEEEIVNTILEFIYNDLNDDTLPLFLKINDLDKKTKRKKEMELYLGLEDAMHNLMHLSLGGGKKFNKINKMIFHKNILSIGWLIRIARAYFSNAKADGASQLGVEFFNIFKKIILENEDYFINGEGASWAKTWDYSDYIKKVIEENKKNKS